MNKLYNKKSFGDRTNALSSARVIVPILLEIIHPKSVVDIGCNTGEFLAVFKEFGVNHLLGIDGPWNDKSKFRISKNDYLQADLAKPFKSKKKIDLAVSLEVAEHLPANSAGIFVQTLISLAPVVLFSAAIPYQGGLHHQNEQWPEYWAGLFGKYKYVPIDCIRNRIWNNTKVSYWYAQNILLFVRKDFLAQNLELKQLAYRPKNMPAMSMVHPHNYLNNSRKLKQLSGIIPKPLRKFLAKIGKHSI